MSYDPNNPYASNPTQPSGPLPPGTVPNYLVHSIVSLICCGGVFAIPAIIYASQVNSKLAAGDYNGAVESSNKAKTWVMVAVGIACVCGGISVLIQIMAAMAQ